MVYKRSIFNYKIIGTEKVILNLPGVKLEKELDCLKIVGKLVLCDKIRKK